MKISGMLVDIELKSIYPADIFIENDIITEIKKTNSAEKLFIMPGLIDSHVHVESSMLTPGFFAKACVPHGTIGVVSDPHEIANVSGIAGVEYMINEGGKVPFKFWFGAPSCVPATTYETSGDIINSNAIEKLLMKEEIKYLAEMMNFPGVLSGDNEVLSKIKHAKILNKRIDGHCPGLRGEKLRKYIEAGISTDHECSTIEEAKEKIEFGMKILIREGSAARNLDALKTLYLTNPDDVMLCSDDIHPEMLEKRHINKLISKLINEGFDIFDVIRSATINPVLHYGLNSGSIRKGQKGDMIVVDSPEQMNVLETWIEGRKVFDRGKVLFDFVPGNPINKFNCTKISEQDILVKKSGDKLRIIQAYDGELFTTELFAEPGNNSLVMADTRNDILKIVVKDRYNDSPPAVGFIKGFGLINGAFASSVAHDSHNIIAVGTNDSDIVQSVNEIICFKGGLAVSFGNKVESLQLNVAGIMSDRPCSEVAAEYQRLSGLIKELGCPLSAPFMTLSFMALLVIPDLKMSDKGLFSGKSFSHVPLFAD